MNYETVIICIQDNPDKTLKDMWKEFGIRDVAILYILTIKKDFRYIEKNEDLRKEFT